MINLLPPQRNAQIKYGRRNTALRLWLIFTGIAIVGLIIILFVSGIYINAQSKNLERQITDSKAQLKAQNLNQVQKDAKEISGDIKTIDQVLSQEIRFSDLMQDVGKVMPPGTVLSSLNLSKVSGAVDLSANSKDYASAAQIAVNLNDPKNGLFDKVDIVNINCSSDTAAYKCTATFRALFNKAAQKKYLSVPEAKS
jgi:Tfp pilus assembly protein PilN